MKHLRLFEEFNTINLGNLVEMGTDVTLGTDVTQIEIDGFPVKIFNQKDVSGHKSIYIIILVIGSGSSGSSGVNPQCFSELDDAKNHISYLINLYQNPTDGEPLILKGRDSFVIKKTILDAIFLKSEEEGGAMDKIVSPKEIYSFLEKNLRPITLCYTNILPNLFKGIGKGKMNERVIQDELLNLQRELKYDDKVRAKEAIARWGRFINPMRLSPEGKNNFQMWIESSDGRKYGDIIKDFESMQTN